MLTNPLTGELSAKPKGLIGLSHSSDDHHEVGASSIGWDVNCVQIVKASMQCNPFSLDSESLMNIMTGHHATPQVQTHPLSARDMGLAALETSLGCHHQKTMANKQVKIKTFHTSFLISKKSLKSLETTNNT